MVQCARKLDLKVEVLQQRAARPRYIVVKRISHRVKKVGCDPPCARSRRPSVAGGRGAIITVKVIPDILYPTSPNLPHLYHVLRRGVPVVQYRGEVSHAVVV